MQLDRKILCLLPGMMILAACASKQLPSESVTQAPQIINSPAFTVSIMPSEQSLQTAGTATRTPTQAASTEPPAITDTAVVLPGPDCTVGLPPTRPDMEGPYFLAGSPEKATLIEPGMDGTILTISGYVMTVDCKLIPNAKLEFWQADANGDYDLQGYRLRGHVFTDANGRYQIQTILPAAYETRPRHIHVMVLPPGQPGLTTQLYFPGDSPYPELTLAIDEESQGVMAVYNFVLATR